MPLYMKEVNGARFGFVFSGRTSRDRYSDWEKPSYCKIKKGTITKLTHTPIGIMPSLVHFGT